MKIALCRSCQRKIVWLKTSRQKPIPVDADGVNEGDVWFDPKNGRHVTHFATCPNADKHRKPKQEG
jgi:hypothetical protein